MKLKLLHLILMVSKNLMYAMCIQVLLYSTLFANDSDAQIRTIKDIDVKTQAGTYDLKSIFLLIEKSTDLKFVYPDRILTQDEIVLSRSKKESVYSILSNVARSSGLKFKQVNNIVYVGKNIEKTTINNSVEVYIQTKTITGTVTTSEEGEPLPGVNIVEKGTINGTVTDIDGKYSLNIGQDGILVFSSVGYVGEEVDPGNRSVIDLQMTEDITQLKELVVVGYGTAKKSDLTSSISSISTQDLPSTSAMSINNMIQGRVPGVDIVPANGMPGAGVSIKVRGVSSINNSEPLYVIDGVQFHNSGGTQHNVLSMINPNDIDRIEILKDASAAAIYGANGANGVILITTKKGQSGAPRINFEAQYGVAQVPRKLNVLDAGNYRDLLIEQQVNANPNSSLEEVVGSVVLNETYSGVNRTNWQDVVFRDASLYQANLNIGGGSEMANYMFSFSYADQEAIVIGSDFSRYTMRIATDFKIGEKIKIGENLNLSYTNRNDVGGAGRDFITGALRMAPYVPVYDDSNWWGFGNNNNVNDNNNADNPATTAHYVDDSHRNARIIGNIYGSIDFTDFLRYHASLGINYDQNYRNNFRRAFVNSNEEERQSFEENHSWGINPLFEQTLTFDKEYGQHTITLLGGMAVSRYGSSRSLTVYGTNFPNEELDNILLAQDALISDANITENALLSYFTRLNYSFADKYLLTAIFRSDASPNFSKNNRWGNFPAFSVAWKLHEEEFLQNIPGISTMKLRLGWGKNGISNIGNFRYSSYTHSKGMSYPVGYPGAENYLIGTTIKALASPDIQWEEATTKNIGLDLGFYADKLTFTAEYFNKMTEQILVEVPTSPSMGLGLASGNEGGSRIANAASARNNGVELSLNFANAVNDFQYNISANMTYVDNEVTALGDGEPIQGPSYNGQAAMTLTDVGNPIGAFYGYVVDKVYLNQAEIDADNTRISEATDGKVNYYQSDLTKPGDIRFKDIDGNGFVNSDDRTYIGSPIPKYSYGFAFDGSYKGFDFALNLTGNAGVDIYSAYYVWNLEGMRVTGNHSPVVLNRWTPDNTDTSIPRAISGDPNNNLRSSDRYIDNGSFMKIRNLAIGYTLPTQLLERVSLQGISKLRVYVAGQNLVTFTGYERGFDPEVAAYDSGDMDGYNLGRGIDRGFTPIPRTVNFGLQVSF